MIPGNDDAIRAVEVYFKGAVETINAARSQVVAEEAQAEEAKTEPEQAE